jgi:DNA-binding MarR family transcriptional regulator
MSTPVPVRRTPLIALVERAARALQVDMVRAAHARGHGDIRLSHNAVFGTLSTRGDRSVDLAARAGMTRQSMGEVVRDMTARGLLEMVPDPEDGRAKLVRYTERGLAEAQAGHRYITELEERFSADLGDDYEAARRVLERVVVMLVDEH